MSSSNTTFFEAILDVDAWLSLPQWIISDEPTKREILKTFLLFFLSVISVDLFIFRWWPEKISPTMAKWISGFGSTAFLTNWIVFMCVGDRLFSMFSISTYLLCFPILYITSELRFSGARPHSSEPWNLHHVFYLFVGIQYLCVRHFLEKAPLGEVDNSKFLACQIKMVLMTVYNVMGAIILTDAVRIMLARKFVVYDEETGERKIVWTTPKPEGESVDLDELVRDIQNLIDEKMEPSEGDEQETVEEMEEKGYDEHLLEFTLSLCFFFLIIQFFVFFFLAFSE